MRQIQRSILEKILTVNPNPRTLLDIGCGTGELTHALAAHLPNTQISAVDLDISKTLPSNNIEFFEGSVTKLPFTQDSFDVICTSLSLHHWEDKQKGITEVFRLLRPGGTLVIGDPLLAGRLSNRFLGWLAQVIDGGIFASPKELESYLSTAGFTLRGIEVAPNSWNTLFVISALKPTSETPSSAATS